MPDVLVSWVGINSFVRFMKTVVNYLKSHPWAMHLMMLVLAILISVQKIALGINAYWGGEYTHFNNFMIFKYSFSHLLHGQNLYAYYPSQYADLYKYSPTFAAWMAPFWYLPSEMGLIIWNCINIGVLYAAFSVLKTLKFEQKLLLTGFVLLELIIATQNAQSNALLAGLTVLVYALLEKGKTHYAAIFLVIGTFIKIYSIIGCLLFLLYPNRIKSIFILSLWGSIALLTPLVFTSFSTLLWQYENWYTLLLKDQRESVGMSLFAFTQLAFPMGLYKPLTWCMGLIMLLSPLLRIPSYKNQLFRLHYLALVLLWMVVFNHKAESPTFIMAMSGIGIWYFSSQSSPWRKALVILCFVFTSLWFSDLIPGAYKSQRVDVMYIKSFFPALICFVLFYDLIRKPAVSKQ